MHKFYNCGIMYLFKVRRVDLVAKIVRKSLCHAMINKLVLAKLFGLFE